MVANAVPNVGTVYQFTVLPVTQLDANVTLCPTQIAVALTVGTLGLAGNAVIVIAPALTLALLHVPF